MSALAERRWGALRSRPSEADEPEPAGTGGEDVELPGVVGDVVAFAQQQQVVQVGAAAVDPVDAVMRVQALGVRAAGVGAMTVLARQQGPVLAVGDQAVGASDVEHVRCAVVDHGADPAVAQQPLHHPVGKTRPTSDPRVRPGNRRIAGAHGSPGSRSAERGTGTSPGSRSAERGSAGSPSGRVQLNAAAPARRRGG